MEYKGRRLAFMVNTFPTLISWIIIYFATSVSHLITGGFLQGLSMGGHVSLGIICVAEYSDPEYRGVFMVMKTASLYWGIWIANALGTVLYWRTSVLLMIVPSLYAFVTPLIWPESPIWLASKGQFEKCSKSFQWLRGTHEKDSLELKKLIEAQTRYLDNASKNRDSLFTKLGNKVCSENFYKPMFLAFALFLQFYACGKLVHASYALTIIHEITSSESTAFMGMLILDGVTVSFMYLGCFAAKRFKRRILFFTTCIAAISTLVILSLYLYLIQIKVISQITVISLLLLILYSISISLGPTTLPTSIYGELMPAEHKGLCTLIVAAYSGIVQSLFLKCAPYMFKSIGLHSTFLIFAGITSLCLIYLYKYMPETKDKTLQEIEDSFMTCKNKDVELKCMLNKNDKV